MMRNPVLRLRDRRFPSLIGLSLLTAALLSAGAGARAQTVFYDNTSRTTAFNFGSGSEVTGVFSGNGVTGLLADDITLTGSQDVHITSFSVEITNYLSPVIQARPIVSIYTANPGFGNIGTLLASVTLPLTTFKAASTQTVTYDPGAGTLFTAPAGGTFWAGITFDNDFGTGSSPNLLTHLGQLAHDPPTVGSSRDLFFLADAAVASAQSSPAGTYYFFGQEIDPSKPNASFGWRFSGIAAVPEPGVSAAALCGVLLLPTLRRRVLKKRGGDL